MSGPEQRSRPSSRESIAGVDPAIELVIIRTVEAAFRPLVDKIDQIQQNTNEIRTFTQVQEQINISIRKEIELGAAGISQNSEWMQSHITEMHNSPLVSSQQAPAPAPVPEKKEWNPVLVAFLSAAVSAPATGLVLFLLKGTTENIK